MKKKKILLTLPVYNEEKILEKNVKSIIKFIYSKLKNKDINILICNNGSIDKTDAIAKELCKKHEEISYLEIKEKGRGIALKTAWTNYDADFYIYMDIDLSTSLNALPRLITHLEEEFDIVTGSRHIKSSKVKRAIHREILSKGYNYIIKKKFNSKIKDMQCGFKGVNKRIVEEIIPKIKDTKWFFDTELLLLSEKKNYKIKEIPVKWTGDIKSKVEIIKTIFDYLKNIKELKRRKEQISFPKHVIIQTTSKCNSKCIICPHKDISNELPQGEMSSKLYKKIINECSKYRVQNIMPYLMNEPLMDQKIVEKINYAKNNNSHASVHLVSNGSLLNRELSKDLIKSELDFIEFSVLGIKGKTYEKIMIGLKLSKVINKVSEFINLTKQYNKSKDFVRIKLIRVKEHLTIKEKNEAIRFWKEKKVFINYYEDYISRAGNITKKNPIKRKVIKGCNSEWTMDMIHILYNGDVILCCMDWRREVILGNINKQSIYEIWNSKNYQHVREQILGIAKSPENFICKRCELSAK